MTVGGGTGGLEVGAARPNIGAARAGVASQRRGIILMVLSSGLLVLGDAGSKWLAVTYPIGQIIFLRGLVIIALLVAVTGPRGLRRLMPHELGGQLQRAALFVIATFLMVLSLKLLPMPTVSAINFAAPIIVTALAPVMLGEIVGVRRWASVLAGFCGVLLIVAPFGETWSWAVLVPLGSAAAVALRDVMTRKVIETETTQSVVFMTIGASVLAGAVTLPFGWVSPTGWDYALFVAQGLASGCGQLMQVAAFRAAEAAFLAPFRYSLLLWSVVVAFVVWGHVPDAMVMVGAAVIVISGVALWYIEVVRRAPA